MCQVPPISRSTPHPLQVPDWPDWLAMCQTRKLAGTKTGADPLIRRIWGQEGRVCIMMLLENRGIENVPKYGMNIAVYCPEPIDGFPSVHLK